MLRWLCDILDDFMMKRNKCSPHIPWWIYSAIAMVSHLVRNTNRKCIVICIFTFQIENVFALRSHKPNSRSARLFDDFATTLWARRAARCGKAIVWLTQKGHIYRICSNSNDKGMCVQKDWYRTQFLHVQKCDYWCCAAPEIFVYFVNSKFQKLSQSKNTIIWHQQ